MTTLKPAVPTVFVFNPFAEAYIAQGKAFTPVKHQAMLAEDLANLPQFLCKPDDIVLVGKRPSASFLNGLKQAGFALPEFVELRDGRIDPSSRLCQRKIGELRPWAWGPDSVEVLGPLFARVGGEARTARQFFNNDIARLYSKAWSAEFLRTVLARCDRIEQASEPAVSQASRPAGAGPVARRGADARVANSGDGAACCCGSRPWLCSEQEVGIAVDRLEDALEAIAAIRGRGHQRVVVKEAHGLAGHNAIRLWEPQVLPAQRKWLAHALRRGRRLVVEPWLEREMDFSVQLEMECRRLKLCGYTGLVNDRKGQYVANWAEANYARSLPAQVARLLGPAKGVCGRIERLYGEIFSLLEAELRDVSFIGPVSIDGFVYRTRQGECRLKPVVEINPRYTMGRLTLELMKRAAPGTCGLLRLVSRVQAREETIADFSAHVLSLRERAPLQLEGESPPKICRGAICLNNPEQARVCLVTFEVSRALNLPGSLSDREPRNKR